MISKILHYKKAFEDLKLLEHINNKLEATKKIDKFYEKFLIIPMALILLPSILSCFFMIALPISLWYLSIPLITIVLTMLISANIVQPKLEKYVGKKYGKQYFEDILLNTLQSIENQKIIVGYFNELCQRHNELLPQYNELLLAFDEKNYQRVIIKLKKILANQQIIENNNLIEENKERRIKDFKASLGFVDSEIEQELEIGNLKKYL